MAKKGSLDVAVFHQLYEQFDGYTWYLQSVLNRLSSQGYIIYDRFLDLWLRRRFYS